MIKKFYPFEWFCTEIEYEFHRFPVPWRGSSSTSNPSTDDWPAPLEFQCSLCQCYLVYPESVWPPTFDFFMYLLETQPLQNTSGCQPLPDQEVGTHCQAAVSRRSKAPWVTKTSLRAEPRRAPAPALPLLAGTEADLLSVTKRNIGFQKMSVHVITPPWQLEHV